MVNVPSSFGLSIFDQKRKETPTGRLKPIAFDAAEALGATANIAIVGVRIATGLAAQLKSKGKWRGKKERKGRRREKKEKDGQEEEEQAGRRRVRKKEQ